MQVWSLGWEDPWKRKWQPTPCFLPGKSHRQRSLVGSMGLQRVGHDWANEQVVPKILTYTLPEFPSWVFTSFSFSLLTLTKLPWLLSGKESACQWERCGFSPWFEKTPGEEWQPSPVFLPGKCHGQGCLAIKQHLPLPAPDKHHYTVCSTYKQYYTVIICLSLAAIV